MRPASFLHSFQFSLSGFPSHSGDPAGIAASAFGKELSPA